MVSTENQLKGAGRNGKSWESFENSLAFSFTLAPHEKLLLTSLEIGILIIDFFQNISSTEIKVKWPNDLIINNKKCGGILIDYINKNTLIVGIGININNSAPHYSAVKSKKEVEIIDLTKNIYKFILSNRKKSEEIISKWNQHCSHMNLQVLIDGPQQKTQGIFQGVDSQGAAVIFDPITQITSKIISGSLFI